MVHAYQGLERDFSTLFPASQSGKQAKHFQISFFCTACLQKNVSGILVVQILEDFGGDAFPGRFSGHLFPRKNEGEKSSDKICKNKPGGSRIKSCQKSAQRFLLVATVRLRHTLVIVPSNLWNDIAHTSCDQARRVVASVAIEVAALAIHALISSSLW